MFARNGSVAIRQLRNAAAAAYRCGRLDTAATLRCMAEAAEREYLKRFFDPYFGKDFNRVFVPSAMFDVSADTTAWIMTALVAMALLGVVFAAHWFWR